MEEMTPKTTKGNSTRTKMALVKTKTYKKLKLTLNPAVRTDISLHIIQHRTVLTSSLLSFRQSTPDCSDVVRWREGMLLVQQHVGLCCLT